MSSNFSLAIISLSVVGLIGLTACDLTAVEGARLRVTNNSEESGFVGIRGSDGIICPDNCEEVFPVGRVIELIATPLAGFEFTGWGEDCATQNSTISDSQKRSCVLTMSEDRTVSANFNPRRQFLEVSVAQPDMGRITIRGTTINCSENSSDDPTCKTSLPYGQRIRVHAAPMQGARLAEWKGDCVGRGECVVSMTQDRKISASFEPDSVLIEIQKTGNGAGRVISAPAAIDCGSTCDAKFPRGQILTLRAEPAAGSTFTGWTGKCAGLEECRITLEDNYSSISAEFSTQAFTLTASITGAGAIISSPAGINCSTTETDCEVELSAGTEITLTTLEDEGFEHESWTGDCSGIGSCTLTMDSNKNVGSIFGPAEYDVTVNLVGPGRGRIISQPNGIDCPSECVRSFPHGTQVTLIAQDEPGSTFAGWTGACVGSEECVLSLTNFETVVARFEIERHTIHIASRGLGSGRITSDPATVNCPGNCSIELDHQQTIEMIAEPLAGSKFMGWEGICVGLGPCIVTAESSGTVAAVFESTYELVTVSKFTMGSTVGAVGAQTNEQPPVETALTGNFFMKNTEVTHGEWEKLMGQSPSSFPGCGPACPIETVSYIEATEYLNRLSDRHQLPRCYSITGSDVTFAGVHCLGFRLPTAAEWEYAARANSQLAYSDAPNESTSNTCEADINLDSLGWYCNNSSLRIHDVAQKRPNRFGLYDMNGNVREWTETNFDPNYYATLFGITVDPTGANTTAIKEIRGGGWNSVALRCRTAAREGLPVSSRFNDVGFRPVRRSFVKVEAGVYQMGSIPNEPFSLSDERPKRTVFHSQPIYISPNEITQGEYTSLSGINPSAFQECGGDCPAEQVSFDEFVQYTNQLSIQATLQPCYVLRNSSWEYANNTCTGYRLLTESEWERAARGKTETAIFTGSIGTSTCSEPSTNAVGWYCGNSEEKTHPVGEKIANEFGLYDVVGNVQEFVFDYYSSNYYAQNINTDPKGPTSGTTRVARGGHYDSIANQCRHARRQEISPQYRSSFTGTRVSRAACTQLSYEPSSAANAPASGRTKAATVFDGHKVFIIGGLGTSSTNNVLAFDPIENKWTDINMSGAPILSRVGHGAVFTGKNILVWGGENVSTGVGAVYSPARDEWRAIDQGLRAPSPRSEFAHVWTGTEWMIWGGRDSQTTMADGAIYSPDSDSWHQMRRSSLGARHGAAAVKTSTGIMVLGGLDDSSRPLSDYAFYQPRTNTWSQIGNMPQCSGRTEAVVIDKHVLVVSETGWCQYDIQQNQWSIIPGRPNQRILFSPGDGIFTSNGTELLVYGGSISNTDGVLDSFEPITQQWRTPSNGSPQLSALQSIGIWTGCRLFIWSDVANRNSGLLIGN